MTIARFTPAIGVLTLGLLLLTACSQSTDSSMSSHSQPVLNQSQFDAPPVAPKQSHSTEIHGVTWEDDYFWMRLSDEQKDAEAPDDQTTAAVDYLNKENSYKEEVLKSTESFLQSLFDEIVGRIKQDDQSVPLKDNGYHYYSRYEEGKEYAIYCRKEGNLDAE